MRTLNDLSYYQSLPLDIKISLSKDRIRQWIYEFGEDNCYISFSGGKDSTVLLDLIRNVCGYNVEAIFVDVPTQFFELKDFALSFDNVTLIKPKYSFFEICSKYGFPFFSKEIALHLHRIYRKKDSAYLKYYDGSCLDSFYSHYDYNFMLNAPFKVSHMCCDILKKNPIHSFVKNYHKVAFLGTMACESNLRKISWLHNGCNAFDLKFPASAPLSFWTEQDILKYIYINKLPICSCYGNVYKYLKDDNQLVFDFIDSCKYKCSGCSRTGCVLCGFGMQCKNDNRFKIIKEQYPYFYKLLDVKCNNGYSFRSAIEWINNNSKFNIDI